MALLGEAVHPAQALLVLPEANNSVNENVDGVHVRHWGDTDSRDDLVVDEVEVVEEGVPVLVDVPDAR